MTTASPDILHNLKRRRARERAKATRISTILEGYEDYTPLDDLENYCGHLKETLERIVSLDDSIHDLLPDKEFEEDITSCEEYIIRRKGQSRRLFDA